jgi:N-terminal domain of anti-restriction factor ArdC
MNSLERKDVYTRVTDHIIADLEKGIRTWMKPWNVAHTPREGAAPPPSGARRSFRHFPPDLPDLRCLSGNLSCRAVFRVVRYSIF